MGKRLLLWAAVCIAAAPLVKAASIYQFEASTNTVMEGEHLALHLYLLLSGTEKDRVLGSFPVAADPIFTASVPITFEPTLSDVARIVGATPGPAFVLYETSLPGSDPFRVEINANPSGPSPQGEVIGGVLKIKLFTLDIFADIAGSIRFVTDSSDDAPSIHTVSDHSVDPFHTTGGMGDTFDLQVTPSATPPDTGTEPAPLPSAAAGGLAILGSMFFRRRRRHQT